MIISFTELVGKERILLWHKIVTSTLRTILFIKLANSPISSSFSLKIMINYSTSFQINSFQNFSHIFKCIVFRKLIVWWLIQCVESDFQVIFSPQKLVKKFAIFMTEILILLNNMKQAAVSFVMLTVLSRILNKSDTLNCEIQDSIFITFKQQSCS